MGKSITERWLRRRIITIPPVNLHTIKLLTNFRERKMKSLVIYHGNCADGFGAAYAAWKHFGDDAEYIPGVYGNPPPDCTDRVVYLLDFSYKADVVRDIAAVAEKVIVLDHHVSAIDDLMPLLDDDIISGVFDTTRSGAAIAWDYFNPSDTVRPTLINYIEDRDLWRFEMPHSRAVAAALFSYPYDFAVWDSLVNKGQHGIDRLISEGVAIERKHWKDIEEFAANARRATIAGYDVPIINCPYMWASDMGHKLAQDAPFAACYWDTPEGRVFSLRSTNDGINVAEIAKQYGGGGHPHAAGFRLAEGESL